MNPLSRDLFFKGFRKKMADAVPSEEAEKIWVEAG